MDLKIGIIGGTGLAESFAAAGGEAVEVDTPFGRPSGPILMAPWRGGALALLARHGPGHTLPPSAVPYRANIYALKSLGVTHIIASGATGSLRETIHPGELVVVDQAIDRTFRRAGTFFERGPAVHVELSEPFCPTLRRALLAARGAAATQVHDGGVYVCMEGPQFSTVAESRMHRAWGADVVGMTCMPEAKLAREAEMCYALVALPTDYDCWRPHPPGQDHASLLEEILRNLRGASAAATRLIHAALEGIPRQAAAPCACQTALDRAVWSDRRHLDPEVLCPVELLLRRTWKLQFS